MAISTKSSTSFITCREALASLSDVVSCFRRRVLSLVSLTTSEDCSGSTSESSANGSVDGFFDGSVDGFFDGSVDGFFDVSAGSGVSAGVPPLSLWTTTIPSSRALSGSRDLTR